MHLRRSIETLGLAAILAGLSGLAACSTRDADGAPRKDPPAAAANAAGGRRAPSITLATTDVATVGRSTIEQGTPVTGDLRPIETIDVRARIEGDVTGVYVREGDRVSQGQLLARFEASEQQSAQRSAEADRAAAQSDLATAQWNLEQSQELFKAGAIAERDFKVSQQEVAAARARLAAAEARLRTASQDLGDTRVVAPATGVVDKRLVENGEHVTRGSSLFTVVRNQTLELAAAVPARQAADVRVGQSVHFVADGRRVDGRVSRVSPTIDPSSRSVTVYVQIPNEGGVFKGGTFASGRIVSRTVDGALVVPSGAVRQSQQGGHPFVYRVKGGALDVAEVTLGITDEGRGLTQILSGLEPGDVVIVGNVGTIGRGMKVNIIGEKE